ncbi:MAG: putative lipid II flippase FtsW [Peptococcaceae bacterium]|jgi:cell division protein FtsW|nr:putative lipid II flippase FtsW [Peptococcaceae bacterium]
MKKRKKSANKELKPTAWIDYPLLFLILALLAYGLIMVQSAGALQGVKDANDAYFYLIQQLKWAGLGAVVAGVIVFMPYHIWRRFAGVIAWLGMMVSIGLLLAVRFSGASVSGGGAVRWLSIAGVTIQPSEIAKLCAVFFLAYLFARYPLQSTKGWGISRSLIYFKQKLSKLGPGGVLLRTIGGLFPGALVVLVLGLIYKQPDLGTMLVVGATCGAMLWQTGLATRWFLIVGAPVVSFLAYKVRFSEYQWDRIKVWLNPWLYEKNEGYQITNAQVAFANGGWFGQGLGASAQKNWILPANHTDYIFVIVGEELGLLGCLLMIGLFVALFMRAYQLARRCPDRFSRLLFFGITTALAVQTVVNLAVVTGVLPTTGITLPFVSYGGSSLLITMIQAGILLSISRYCVVKKTEQDSAKNPPVAR